jgi:hypothetical protein
MIPAFGIAGLKAENMNKSNWSIKNTNSGLFCFLCDLHAFWVKITLSSVVTLHNRMRIPAQSLIPPVALTMLKVREKCLGCKRPTGNLT